MKATNRINKKRIMKIDFNFNAMDTDSKFAPVGLNGKPSIYVLKIISKFKK
ncbi:MAG: hypothetical protein ACI9SD_001342 [Pseudohongiellaceae bacterium]|jgi:hypothetical protein